MPRKKNPYMEFETKEEFDKIFDDIFNNGKKQGYEDGIVLGLSYFFDGGLDEAEETFKNGFDIRCRAMQVAADRRIAKDMREHKIFTKIRELEAKAGDA